MEETCLVRDLCLAWVSLAHLLSSPRLSFQDGLGCFVVLVGHGAGKGGQALPVSHVQVDVGVRNQQLNDDTVLVADGHVDRRSSFCILWGPGTDFNIQVKIKSRKNMTRKKFYIKFSSENQHYHYEFEIIFSRGQTEDD